MEFSAFESVKIIVLCNVLRVRCQARIINLAPLDIERLDIDLSTTLLFSSHKHNNKSSNADLGVKFTDKSSSN